MPSKKNQPNAGQPSNSNTLQTPVMNNISSPNQQQQNQLQQQQIQQQQNAQGTTNSDILSLFSFLQ